MNSSLRERLEAFLRPHYQDLDGVSRFDDVLRIARIARAIHQPRTGEETAAFERLLLFHLLGGWLEKIGNLSRLSLAVGELAESDLRATGASIRRLHAPQTCCEQAVAAAVVIDRAGVRGAAERISRARREGLSLSEVARDEETLRSPPEWMTPEAREMFAARQRRRTEFCRAILDEEDETAVSP